MSRTWRVVIAVYPKPWWEPEYFFWNPLRPYWQRGPADSSFVRRLCYLLCFVDDVRRRRWVERKKRWVQGSLPVGKAFDAYFNELMVKEYSEQHSKQLAVDV